MLLSQTARTRLLVLNAFLWLAAGIAALAVLGGPQGLVERTVLPIHRELGGIAGLVGSAVGLGAPALPGYEIAVAPELVQTAELMRAASAGTNPSPYGDTPWVPARFRAGDESFDVELQLLSGVDEAADFRNRDWRLRFGARHAYRDMRELTLRSGSAGELARESVVREIAARLGLFALPSGLASLRVNGRDAGVVLWAEGGSPELLERLGDPRGEILAPRVRPQPLAAELPDELGARFARASHAPVVHRDQRDGAPVHRLRGLVQLIRNAGDEEFERSIGQLIDVEKYLRFDALVWVFGDARIDGLQRAWYFDPVTGLLEPVVTDLGGGAAAPALGAGDGSLLSARLLRSDAYRARRNRMLWDLVARTRMDVASSAERALGARLTEIARSGGSLARPAALYGHAVFRREARIALRERVAAIRAALEATEVETRTHRDLEARTPQLVLELAPHGLAEIELAELRLEFNAALRAGAPRAAMRLIDLEGAQRRTASVPAEVIGSSLTLRPERFEFHTVRGAEPGRAAWRVEIELPFLPRDQWSRPGHLRQVQVAYRNAVTGERLPTVRIGASQFAAGAAGSDLPAALRPVEQVIAEAALPLARVGDEIVLPPGRHVLRTSLVVPASHRLRLEPGVDLRLAPGVSIVAFRGISARGTRARPIRLHRADPERPWGAVAVVRAPEPSALEFVSVSGGSKTTHAGIELLGQLSFHASDFSLSDSEVTGSQDGDGVSVKRASYRVVRSEFADNAADGFDSKWSTGSIEGSWFSGNGDNGLELVDSRLELQASVFAGAGDKSITARGDSRVAVSDVRMLDEVMEIVTRDDALVEARRAAPWPSSAGAAARVVGAPVAMAPPGQSSSRVQFNMLYSSSPVNGKKLY